MTKINVKEVEMKANELNHDVELVKKELKRVQSLKCNWLKKKHHPDYEQVLEEVLKEEQLLKEARTFITGYKKTTVSLTQEDVDKLTYDETVRALNNIRSKKTNTRWLTPIEGDNDEFRNACRIEQMIKEHQKNVKPIEDNTVRKSEIQNIIELIDMTDNMSIDKVREMLASLIQTKQDLANRKIGQDIKKGQ